MASLIDVLMNKVETQRVDGYSARVERNQYSRAEQIKMAYAIRKTA